jgi:transposase
MIKTQKKLLLSPYAELYDILVPANHFLRRMHDDIDFSFIYDELVGKYSQDMGRTAYDPVMMFKYLILKTISKLSDVDLIEDVCVNMAYKFFLDIEPEAMPIDPTTLCKFRRQRLKDMDFLDLLLGKTFKMAEESGILVRREDGKIHVRGIIDGTHTDPSPRSTALSRRLRSGQRDCAGSCTSACRSWRALWRTTRRFPSRTSMGRLSTPSVL